MATPSSNQQKLGFLASMAFGDISGAQPRLIARDRPTANGADSSRRFALPLKSFLPPSLCSAAFIIATVLASPAAASDADVTAEVPAKGNAVGEASHYSSGNLGLSLQGYSGTVGGSYMLGGGISSPWIWRCLRVSAAFGVAFYPDALASDPDAAWTRFGYGHARVELGPPFLRTAPIRPYAFAGLAFSVVGEAMSDDAFSVGGLGGIGLEVGFSGPDSSTGPVTYGFEFAGVGSGASVSTPAGDRNLLSGFSARAVIRSYFW